MSNFNAIIFAQGDLADEVHDILQPTPGIITFATLENIDLAIEHLAQWDQGEGHYDTVDDIKLYDGDYFYTSDKEELTHYTMVVNYRLSYCTLYSDI